MAWGLKLAEHRAMEDAAYADAVKRGDKETALRMIREAAAKAMPNTKVVDKDGLPKICYHSVGSSYIKDGLGDFTEFDGSIAKDGFMFRGSEEWIGKDGWGARNNRGEGKFKAVFLNIENPLVVDANGANYTRVPNPLISYQGEEYVLQMVRENEQSLNELRKDDSPSAAMKRNSLIHSWEYYSRMDGKYLLPDAMIHAMHEMSDENFNQFDGVIIKNVDEGEKDGVGDDYITENPYAIKSADITYDDAGNLIPLSQRFDQSNPDIRY